MKELHIQVIGRVQGVGFRQFTASRARRLGLLGWVRNCSDGSVECRVQGSPSELQRFLKEVSKGPALARVDRLDQREVPPQSYSGFDITY
ncbi:MAG: acylphosphatase [Leptospiraceae bacterium]|nr:acylphosphatase [Leptospiraceae bacterium]